jgi:hypothetical protein
MAIGLVTGPLGEELGWRGFALPRLQERTGPLAGSLILGVLWAAWHLPLFFIPEWTGSIDPAVLMLAYFSWVVPFAVFMTWVFNHTKGSLITATLLHTALNAAIGLVPMGILLVPNDLFLQAKIYAPLAIVLIIVTRGKLGYTTESEVSGPMAAARPEAPALTSSSGATPGARGSLLRKIVIGVVVVLVLAWGVANVVYTLVNGAN